MYEMKLFNLYQSWFDDDDDPVMINADGFPIILSFLLINPQLHFLEDKTCLFSFFFWYSYSRVKILVRWVLIVKSSTSI